MSTKDFFESKIFQRVIWGIGIFIIALVIFQAGVFIGYKRASFSFRYGDNYYSTFGSGPMGGMMRNFPPGLPPDDFPAGHGVSGKIIKVSLPTVLVAGDDGVEKSVLVASSTLIREFRQMISPADLKVDDTVVVIGSPNAQSQIEAKLIRIIPAMPTATPQK